jgi:hypothetical protein
MERTYSLSSNLSGFVYENIENSFPLATHNDLIYKLHNVGLYAIRSLTSLLLSVVSGIEFVSITPFYACSLLIKALAELLGYQDSEGHRFFAICAKIASFWISSRFSLFWNFSNLIYFNFFCKKLLNTESHQRVFLDSFNDLRTVMNEAFSMVITISFFISLALSYAYSWKLIVPVIKIHDFLIQSLHFYMENFESFASSLDIATVQREIDLGIYSKEDFRRHESLRQGSVQELIEQLIQLVKNSEPLDEITLRYIEDGSCIKHSTFVNARLIYLYAMGPLKSKKLPYVFSEDLKTFILSLKKRISKDQIQTLAPFFSSSSRFFNFHTLRGNDLDEFLKIREVARLNIDILSVPA